MRTSVYVHFPWCLKKCPYCDFNSYGVSRDAVPHEGYADAVLAELEWRATELADAELVSVFFGGGTPSLWEAPALGRVLAGIRNALPRHAADVEVTVECNPTSIDTARAEALREAGVDRLSIGVQSLDGARLAHLGRLHDAEGALRSLREAVAVMPRVSGDLIFGVPGQSPEAFRDELLRVRDTGVRHISAYALTIESGTQFGELHRKGRLPLAPEDDVAESFLAARALLEGQGMAHYEVSNYAEAGEESRHNLHYWRGGAYLGLGAGAVGCLPTASGARRYRDEALPDRYMARSAQAEVEVWHEDLVAEDRVREALMLGLRTREGVDLAQLMATTGLDPQRGREAAITRRLERSELVLDSGRLRVPAAHWLALDSIVTDIF